MQGIAIGDVGDSIPMFAIPDTAALATFFTVSGAAFDKVQPMISTPKPYPPAVLKKMAANLADGFRDPSQIAYPRTHRLAQQAIAIPCPRVFIVT